AEFKGSTGLLVFAGPRVETLLASRVGWYQAPVDYARLTHVYTAENYPLLNVGGGAPVRGRFRVSGQRPEQQGHHHRNGDRPQRRGRQGRKGDGDQRRHGRVARRDDGRRGDVYDPRA